MPALTLFIVFGAWVLLLVLTLWRYFSWRTEDDS